MSDIVTVKTHEELLNLDLQSLIRKNFIEATEAGKVIYTKANDTIIIDKGNLTCELKIINSLVKKEEDTEKQSQKIDKLENVQKFDPFLNPDKELVVVDDLFSNYKILLNKFPVSENHFLLVTKNFVKQDTLLSPSELTCIFNILQNVNGRKNDKENEGGIFAFFNNGPASGFSQQHKHVQFMKYPLKESKPFPDYVVEGKEFFIPDARYPDTDPLFKSDLSFKHFILPLPKKFESEQEKQELLSFSFIELFKKILNFFKKINAETNDDYKDDLPISYNFLMNENWMMIVPRQKSHYKETLGVNAVGYLGLLLAKNQETKDLVLKDGVDEILKTCGFPIQLDFGKEDEYDY
ncbi:hypothetical protein PACTADRAFT_185676 [Pachysolen tannophilus NRRL Y-2460]|uniref:Uncharacterized protein n=1 Tax=Pachysolen tannophilus NRRL Y-2460 TaxID=669874 RepID=A0A1E4U1U4_PACTA|nr:hypothetical protein PACTADRAFT_185676 [Pachysolen tannophilus NRRL Y-2460]